MITRTFEVSTPAKVNITKTLQSNKRSASSKSVNILYDIVEKV